MFCHEFYFCLELINNSCNSFTNEVSFLGVFKLVEISCIRGHSNSMELTSLNLILFGKIVFINSIDDDDAFVKLYQNCTIQHFIYINK